MNKVKLSDITLQIYDGKHGGCTREDGSGFYFLSVKDIDGLEINYEDAMQIPEDEFNEIYSRTKLEDGDTIYANTGDTIGKSVFITKNPLTSKTAFQKSIAVIKPNLDKVRPRYLYYLLRYDTPRLRKISSGSGQKNLLLDTMRDFETTIAEYEDQIHIALILGTLDDKIKNNNKICKELESMAKTLYDYWFMQFDFPDENGRPYRTSGGKMVWNDQLKREIPKGWEVKYISELTKVVTGKEDANFSTPNGVFKFFTCSQDNLQCDVSAFSGHAVLIAGNGDFNVKHYTGKFNAYQRTYVLIPENTKFYGAMYIAATKQIQAFKKNSNGSIVKFITKSDVENIPILVPSSDDFFEKLNLILEKIETCERENDELTKLRDWLLPMLMNGQAVVEGR